MWTLLYVQQEQKPNQQKHRVSIIFPRHYFVFHSVQLRNIQNILQLFSNENISNINQSR